MFKYEFTTIAGKKVECDNLILIRKTCEVDGKVGGVVVAEYEEAMTDAKEGLEASIVDEDWYLQDSQLDTNIPYLSNTVNPNVLPIALVKAAYPDCKVKFVTADLKHAKEITVYNNKD